MSCQFPHILGGYNQLINSMYIVNPDLCDSCYYNETMIIVDFKLIAYPQA